MKLLYLVHQFFPKHYTGTERFTLDLAAQMQRMGHYPTVVTYEPNSDVDEFQRLTSQILVKRYTYSKIPVVAFRHAGPADASAIYQPAIERAFRKLEFGCDLVHVCHPMWLSSIAKLCKDSNTPVVMTLTDAWLLCPRALLDLDFRLCNGPEGGEKCFSSCRLRMKPRYLDARSLYYMADEVAAPSRFLPTLIASNGWNRKVAVIPHSINYAHVRRSTNEKPSRSLNFVFIGTLQWHKGVHVLIEAFRRVSNDNIVLKIYGSHNHSDYFKAVLHLMQGDDRIRLLGPFPEERLPDIMNDASVIVVPSTYYENYPLVMLTALAYRVPAIVTNIGGMPEVIKQSVNGFLFDVGRVDQLTDIIEQIGNEPHILDRLKANIVTPRRTEEEALDYENMYRKVTRR